MNSNLKLTSSPDVFRPWEKTPSLFKPPSATSNPDESKTPENSPKASPRPTNLDQSDDVIKKSCDDVIKKSRDYRKRPLSRDVEAGM